MRFVRYRHLLARCALILALFAGYVASAAEGGPAPKPLPVASLNRTAAVDFEKEILPIFKANCLACHNRTKAKASLVLETPADILKGGDSGPAIVAKQAEQSLLFKAAAHRQDPIMPPRENKVAAANLSAEQLALLKRWIDEGATGTVRGDSAVNWQPISQQLTPIYAVAITRDGQFAACGRANQIMVYHLPTRRLVATLADPATGSTPRAHLDLVQSLSFGPDGTLLASGAYREIKLWRRSVPARTPFAQAAAPVSAMAVNGNRIAVGCADGSISIVDSAGKAAAHWKAHAGPIVAVDFAGDGAMLASISTAKSLKVWDAASGEQRGRFDLDSEPKALIFLHQPETRIVVGCADHTLRVCSPSPVKVGALVEQRRPSAHLAAITALAHMPGQPAQFISASADGSARVWDLAKDAPVREIKHGAPVTAVAVRADGKRFATGGADNITRLWEADGKAIAELKGDRVLREAAEEADRALVVAVSDVAFQKAQVASAEKEQKAQADRVKKATDALAAAEKALDEKHDAHFAAVNARLAAEKAKAEKPDDKALDEKVKFQTKHLSDEVRALEKAQLARNTTLDELELGRKASTAADAALATAKGSLASAESSHKASESAAAAAKRVAGEAALTSRALAFSPDGTILTVGGQGRVHTFASETGAAMDVVETQFANPHKIAFASDGRILAAGEDRTLAAIDLGGAWKLDATLASLPATGPPSADIPSDRVNALDFSPDGARLAAGSGVPSRGGDVLLYDVASRKLLKTFADLHSDSVLSLDFSSDGRFLASGGADKFARILDLASGSPARHLEGHTHHILGVAWKRDGRLLATAGADNSIRTWNPLTGDRGKTIGGHSKEVTAVQFIGATDQILSASGDPRLRMVNAAGNEVRSYTGAADFLYSAAATPDGKAIVAGGQDGVLRLWDGTAPEPTASFK